MSNFTVLTKKTNFKCFGSFSLKILLIFFVIIQVSMMIHHTCRRENKPFYHKMHFGEEMNVTLMMLRIIETGGYFEGNYILKFL